MCRNDRGTLMWRGAALRQAFYGRLSAVGAIDGTTDLRRSYWLLAGFRRETRFKWQGTLANARGSENAAMISRDLLLSRDRQGAVLPLRMAVSRQKLAGFCRQTHLKRQGPLAGARGSENAAMIPRDLLPSRDRQGAVLPLRVGVSRQKPAIGSPDAPAALSKEANAPKAAVDGIVRRVPRTLRYRAAPDTRTMSRGRPMCAVREGG